MNTMAKSERIGMTFYKQVHIVTANDPINIMQKNKNRQLLPNPITNLIAMYNIQKIKNDMEKSFTKPRATVDYASLAIT